MSKVLCIYHGNCADGFTAAWAVYRKFGNAVEFHPGVYQDAPPDVTDRHVLLVDFSYKRPVLSEMAAKAKTVLILDHHKSAAEDLAGFEAPCAYEDWHDTSLNLVSSAVPPIAALFDMNRSGAGITWDYFHAGWERPNLVNYVEDRDLWRFKLPLSREVNAYIFAHDYTFKNWDYLNAATADHMGIQHVADMGGAIEQKHHKDVAELVTATRREMEIGGVVLPVCNMPYTLTSDAGNKMAKEHPSKIGVCYWDTPEGRVFSLRSTDDGPDVSKIAAQYGGGGHAHASGFRVPRDHQLAHL